MLHTVRRLSSYAFHKLLWVIARRREVISAAPEADADGDADADADHI